MSIEYSFIPHPPGIQKVSINHNFFLFGQACGRGRGIRTAVGTASLCTIFRLRHLDTWAFFKHKEAFSGLFLGVVLVFVIGLTKS